MVILKILDEEFDETIENISLETAFTTIPDYCFENMIDEPKMSDFTINSSTLVIHGENVTFKIEDYHEK